MRSFRRYLRGKVGRRGAKAMEPAAVEPAAVEPHLWNCRSAESVDLCSGATLPAGSRHTLGMV
jgi:hypothetical protein